MQEISRQFFKINAHKTDTNGQRVSVPLRNVVPLHWIKKPPLPKKGILTR